MTRKLFALFTAGALLAGCSTFKKDKDHEAPLSKAQIQSALVRAKPPQQFGFAVYPTQNGIAMNGRARLHPQHIAAVKSISNELPVIKLRGAEARMKLNAIIDPVSEYSWIDYDTAMELRGSFLGLDGRTLPYKGRMNIGNIEAYAAVLPQLRIEQLFIESIPVYVRMATGSIGQLDRGIKSPRVNALLGYDLLRNFEYIQFDPVSGNITFSSTSTYTPDENLLIGRAAIISQDGLGLAVSGDIDGEATPILLDFAGNYYFARPRATMNTTQNVGLGEVIYVNAPTRNALTDDGMPRAGLQMLMKYKVTICPRTSLVYFERPMK
ncbi:MAG: hypothetical protein JXR25_10485 [Pontiellaceae bacterium]|nr:hypothetical protein [Pontiellaceae bacterium]MBN2785246.1 hypothetical protein [Pontiellaceae bacterium]